ncbi:MAG: GMC oxidoreductase [Candidatus Sulfotelmatobacter sp.]
MSNSISTSSSLHPASVVCFRASAGRKKVWCSRDGVGASPDAPIFSAHQLVHPSLVLAAEARSARIFQHALLPPGYSEILFDVPGTAPCIGGCVIARSPDQGVVDSHHRMFGYRNMYVRDGSVLRANLSVNPT